MARTAASLSAVLLVLTLVGVSWPVYAQGPADPWELQDPPNDVAVNLMGQSSPGLPAQRHIPYVDIVSLQIEDPNDLELTLRLKNAAGFQLGTAPTSSGQGADRIYHFIVLKVPNSPVYLVVAILSVQPPDPNGRAFTWSALLCITTSISNLEYACPGIGGNTQMSHIRLSVQDGALIVPLPKLAFTREGPGFGFSSESRPERIMAGDSITDIQVHSTTHPSLTPWGAFPGTGVKDRAPNGAGVAPPFVLRNGMTVVDLGIKVAQKSLAAGEENLVPITVTNTAGGKRLLALRGETVDPQVGKTWKFGAPPSFALPAGKSTNVTLRVTPPPFDPTKPLSETRLLITVDILSERGSRALLEWRVTPAAPFDAAHSTFYFHNVGPPGFFGGIDPPVVPGFLASSVPFISRQLDHGAAATDEPIVLRRVNFFTNSPLYRIDFATTTGFFSGTTWDVLPNVARLRENATVKIHLEIQSPGAFEASGVFALTAAGVPVSDYRFSASIKSGTTILDLDVPVMSPGTELNPGTNGVVRGTLEFVAATLDPVMAALEQLTPLTLKTRTSTIQIPVEREAPLKVRDDLPRVLLSLTEDFDAFTNPDRVTVFELSLASEASVLVRVELRAENATEGWKVDIRPGNRYALQPNQTARVGILVTSPKNAAEGATCDFKLVARLLETGEAIAAVRLLVTSQTGIPFDNETFEVRPEDSGGALQEPRDTPGPGAVLALLAVVLGFGWIRRRRA